MISFLILLGIIIFCINKNEIEEKIKIEEEIKNDEITLILKENTLTQTGATFIIKNNTEYMYNYGPEYVIEKNEGNKWNEMKLEVPLSWNAIIYELDIKQSRELKIDFTQGYGKLATGKYRLIKNVYRETNEKVNKKIYAEFEIK